MLAAVTRPPDVWPWCAMILKIEVFVRNLGVRSHPVLMCGGIAEPPAHSRTAEVRVRVGVKMPTDGLTDE